MIVNIDESWGQDEALCVNDRLVLFRRELSNTHDVVESDADVRLVERSAGAVGELRVHDEKGNRLLLGEQGQKRDEENRRQQENHGEIRANHAVGILL